MPTHKTERLASDIKEHLSSIMRELKDPRLKSSNLLSIVRVDLSNDLSHCKIYVSAMEGKEKAKEAVKGLENASGFIKRELMSGIKMRKCPDLKFIPDDSIEYSAHIHKILEDK